MINAIAMLESTHIHSAVAHNAQGEPRGSQGLDTVVPSYRQLHALSFSDSTLGLNTTTTALSRLVSTWLCLEWLLASQKGISGETMESNQVNIDFVTRTQRLGIARLNLSRVVTKKQSKVDQRSTMRSDRHASRTV
ncbi:hypothetical protein Agabi119p4_5699 [Agaricus bisporus var. burnettii]|uniref:Uncharacterized protein n=1 Tax=Agaricus bisporus var. burnettii TaxID=192524 RepID=A0A8H7KGN5_AGABI|nr:hypothetical protein Agabi119p4_5699 [Agaricus bisporus var. burnettii]